MAGEKETNADRFLNAFREIEETLARQQRRRQDRDDWTSFKELVDDSDELVLQQKDQLLLFSRLRNSISHNRYNRGRPIADPREDVVLAIERIRDLLLSPPLLITALGDRQPPKILEMSEDIGEFLKLVIENDYSQAPVKSGGEYRLVTTNAVARRFAPDLIEHGIVDTVSVGEVLGSAETGDRLETVGPGTTVVRAINIFSGQAALSVEPPAALLVLGKVGQHPQVLCSRADLADLYARIGA